MSCLNSLSFRFVFVNKCDYANCSDGEHPGPGRALRGGGHGYKGSLWRVWVLSVLQLGWQPQGLLGLSKPIELYLEKGVYIYNINCRRVMKITFHRSVTRIKMINVLRVPGIMNGPCISQTYSMFGLLGFFFFFPFFQRLFSSSIKWALTYYFLQT